MLHEIYRMPMAPWKNSTVRVRVSEGYSPCYLCRSATTSPTCVWKCLEGQFSHFVNKASTVRDGSSATLTKRRRGKRRGSSRCGRRSEARRRARAGRATRCATADGERTRQPTVAAAPSGSASASSVADERARSWFALPGCASPVRSGLQQAVRANATQRGA